MRGAPTHSANAPPIRCAASSSRSSGTTPRTSYALKIRPRSRSPITRCESYRPACIADRLGIGEGAVNELGLGADDEADDALERNRLSVPVPPLRFAEVARREREVTAVHAHRDGDQFPGTAGGTGPLWLVV